MREMRSITPDDVRQFYEGTLAAERVQQLIEAVNQGNPQVTRWMQILDLGNDLDPSEEELAQAASCRLFVNSRMDLLSRSGLWAFSTNPLPALLAGETTVRCQLFGRLGGSAQTFAAEFSRRSGSDREFTLKIPDLPAGFEPLHLTLADFDLGSDRQATPQESFAPLWATTQADRESHTGLPVCPPPCNALAAESDCESALGGDTSRVANKAESGDFWLCLPKNSSSLLVQADRHSQSTLDIVVLEVSVERLRHEAVERFPVLVDKLLSGAKPALESRFELRRRTDSGLNERLLIRARALRPDELCELSTFQVDTLLNHREFRAPTLTCSADCWQLKLFDADLDQIVRRPHDQCALRIALPSAEVRA